jgi:hypothetical protein
VHIPEEVHDVVADCSIVFGAYGAKEDDNIVLGLVGDVYVAEEDHYVMIDVALGVDAAEEADRVVHRVAFGDHDIAAELNRVFVGMRGTGRNQKRREHKQGRKQALSHGGPHPEFYARARQTVPAN